MTVPEIFGKQFFRCRFWYFFQYQNFPIPVLVPPQNSREFSGTGTKFLRCRYRLPVLFSVPNGSHFFLQNGHQGALSLYQYYIKYILISLIDTTNTSSVCNNEYYDDTDQAVLSINIFQGHLHSGLLIAPKTSQE